jgi:hypothetical protein
MKLNNLIGKKFGKLSVIERCKEKRNCTYWICICECGNRHIARGGHLKDGGIKSCGCLNRKQFEYEIIDDYVKIKLVADTYTLIDIEDLDRVKEYSWTRIKQYKCDGIYYAYSWSVGSLARFIMNAPKNILIDHKSRDTLDNRKTNLRFATYSQNGFNKKISSLNNIGYKGVGHVVKSGKYKAELYVDGKRIGLGCKFKTPEEARDAYIEASLKYHGEFSYFNIR